MKVQKDVEILHPEASKTIIRWYPSAAYSDTVAFPFFSLGTIMPIMGGFLATSPLWAFPVEALTVSGAVLVVSNGFGYLVGNMSHANRSMNASNVKMKDMFRFASRKKERKLVEEYYIQHNRPFQGLVTKEQEFIKMGATHTVKTYVVSGKGRTYIEQEITETQSYMWDNAMDSIESLMTVQVQKSKPFTMLSK